MPTRDHEVDAQAVRPTGTGDWLKLALRWAVAAVILWLLFRRVPLAEAMLAARRAGLWTFVPAAFVVVLFRFWIDAATLGYLVSRFHTPFSTREARGLYALIYVINMINWGLGMAALLRQLRRWKGVELVDSTSTTFFYTLIDGTTKVGLGLVGLAVLLGDATLRDLAWPVALVFLGHGLVLGVLMSGQPRWRWLQRLRGLRLLATSTHAGVRDLAVVGALRGLGVAGFVAFAWVGLHAFAVPVPLLYLLATIPVVLIIGGIPITPAGLGTQQAAILYFYRPFGAEADILAFGLLFPVVFMVARLAIGGFYVRDRGRLQSGGKAFTM